MRLSSPTLPSLLILALLAWSTDAQDPADAAASQPAARDTAAVAYEPADQPADELRPLPASQGESTAPEDAMEQPQDATAAPQDATPTRQHSLAAARDIGISVSEPKVYEEATLRSMLEAAEARLAALAFIDQAGVTPGLGRSQGGRLDSTSFSLSVTALPTPTVETTTNRARDATSGELETTTESITESMASVSGTAPTAPPASGATLPTSTFGLSARDLLSEQVALTYQVMNLRLALERSASDRLSMRSAGLDRSGHPEETPIPRKGRVLGFTVSIDRPVKKAIAEVELTLALCDKATDTCENVDPGGYGNTRRISVVSLLPARESYNTVSIKKGSSSIGAGQVTSVFNIGGGFWKSSEEYFIVRDLDTISSTLPPDPAQLNRVSFRWQFRPVLGRKAVEPGPRQVFAVVAFDDEQNYALNEKSLELRVSAATRWLRTKRHGVVGRTLEQTAETPLRTLGLWDIFFQDGPLAPFLQKPTWAPISATHALVTVDGANFSPDTHLLVGSLLVDRSNGLKFSEEDRLAAVIPLADLARAPDVHVINRYLFPVPIRYEMQTSQDPPVATLKLDKCTGTPDGDQGEIVIPVRGVASPDDAERDLVVIVEDQVFLPEQSVLPNGFSTQSARAFSIDPGCGPAGCPLTVRVPLELLRKAREVRVREIFGGPERDDRCVLSVPGLISVTGVQVLSRDDKGADLALTGYFPMEKTGPSPDPLRPPDVLEVLVKGQWKEVAERTEGLALLRLSWAELQGVDALLVRKKENTTIAPQVVALKKVSAEKPKFQSAKLELPVGSTGPITLEGLHLDSISSVHWLDELFDIDLGDRTPEKITFRPPTERFTKAAGSKKVEMRLIDGSKVWYTVDITGPKS